MRHLELFKTGDDFFIQINTLVGRLSLFADHPKFKFADAIDLENKRYKTQGKLSLIKLRKKDLFILEDEDADGNFAQNFIFVNDDISKELNVDSTRMWLKKHVIDFFTRSLSVLFLLLFIVYYFTVMRYYNTTGTLYVLRYITGVLTLVFALAYYYLRSSKTKSSFLKFCFRMELIIFIIFGSINNIDHLIYLNNATDIF